MAAKLGVNQAMVGKWRHRFVADRLDGLFEKPRLTNKKIRCGAHRSVQALERDIRDWIKNPRPCVWVKTADEISSR